MWNRNGNRIEDENLDRFGAELMNAFEAQETEINTAAASPFLYRRIRARIEAEQRRLAEENNPWFALIVQARRAIPVFALLAVAVLLTSLYLHAGDRALPSTDGGAEQMMVAGMPALSQDEVLDSVVGWQSGQSNQQ